MIPASELQSPYDTWLLGTVINPYNTDSGWHTTPSAKSSRTHVQQYSMNTWKNPCPALKPDQWREVAESFGKRWNFHNCIGAIDGKHIAIKCPSNCRTYYFNYKGFHSIVLLALVDANYKFLYIDVGANGLCSDGGVFKDSNLYKALEDGTAGLPSLPITQ